MLNTRALSKGFGVEVEGVDLGNGLTDELFAEVEKAFYAAQVLVLRAQSLTPAQFVAFAKRLGPPQPHVIDQFHHLEDPNILILLWRITVLETSVCAAAAQTMAASFANGPF
ncbi:MAG: TauD/TfdA family dioxygenase [Burkholderiales bacterium]